MSARTTDATGIPARAASSSSDGSAGIRGRPVPDDGAGRSGHRPRLPARPGRREPARWRRAPAGPPRPAMASTVGDTRADAGRREALDLDPSAERLDADAAPGSRRGARGQDVVRAGRVVAGGDRRPGTDEHRAGIPHAGGERIGAVALEADVLGGDRVHRIEARRPGRRPARPRRGPARWPWRARRWPAIRASALEGRIHGVEERGVVADDDRDRVGAVLRLGEQVEGHELGVGAAVGEDDALGWARRAGRSPPGPPPLAWRR